MSRTPAHRVAVAFALICCLGLVGCDPQSAPLYRYHPAYQSQGGDGLRLWMGTTCRGVTSIVYQLKNDDGDILETWRLKARSREGASLTYLTVGQPPKGFVERDRLDRSWESAETATIDVRTQGSRQNQAGNYMSVDTFVEESDGKGGDQWFVQDNGWYTQAEFTEDLVGEDSGVFPLCGPDSPAHP